MNKENPIDKPIFNQYWPFYYDKKLCNYTMEFVWVKGSFKSISIYPLR